MKDLPLSEWDADGCLFTKQTNPFTRSSAFQTQRKGWGGVRGFRVGNLKEEERRRREEKEEEEEEEENRTLTSKRNSLAGTIRTKLRQFVEWSAEVGLPSDYFTSLLYSFNK